ncbi:MAG TPA: APC family permease [Aliidongia sp.]|nr:APC family permease [Aliidongia sp.]
MPGLLRRLGTVEAFSLSLSLIAPTGAMSFAPILMAQSAGRATPLAFLIGAFVAVLVGLSFVAFSRKVAHVGSVYAYVGLVLGPRWGFAAGWMLLLFYAVGSAASVALVGSFTATGLAHFGIEAPYLWLAIGLAAALLSIWLVWNDAKVAARLLLVLEVVSVLAALVLSAVILTQTHLSIVPFQPDPEHGWTGVGFGLAFAIIAFAGFEGAATLGEETHNPKRAIPLAVIGTIVLCGLFFVLVSYAQILGYGLDNIDMLAKSDAPLDDLSTRYIFGTFGAFMDFAAAISGTAGIAGALAAAARILYALGQSGLGSGVAVLHPRHRTPTRAILLLGSLNVIGLLTFGALMGPTDYAGAFFTVGILALLLVYMGVTTAQAIDAFRSRSPIWCGIGLLGTAMLLWPLWNSLYPIPDGAQAFLPYIVAIWLLVGVALIRFRPRLKQPISYAAAE